MPMGWDAMRRHIVIKFEVSCEAILVMTILLQSKRIGHGHDA